jgi:enoyl-CoA hydratase/carnithine racemase
MAMKYGPYSAISVRIDNGILLLTLDRPEQLNTFTSAMMNELVDVFTLVNEDDDVRVVIVTGAGRAFCAGSDLSLGADAFDNRRNPDWSRHDAGSADEVDFSDERVRDGGGKVTLAIFDCLKPVIAAVNGAAVGFGATVLLPMDIRIASTAARFGFPFTRRGIVPESASSWFLPRIVGVATALEWCLTGDLFDAQHAKAAGLVSAIVEPDGLLDHAFAIAARIRDNTAPVSVALTRQMLWRVASQDHPMEAHKIDSRGIYVRGQSAASKEGVSAFLERRPPVFHESVSTDMPRFFPWWKARSYS